MIKKVAVVALDQVAPFELGVLCEVFGTDRTADGFPGYEFNVCTVDGAPVTTRSGYGLTPTADLTPLADADLVAVPAHPIAVTAPEQPGPEAAPTRRGGATPTRRGGSAPTRAGRGAAPEPVIEALRAAAARGARVLSVCSGAFLLGEAGLLDGRRCTTHWQYATLLATRFPAAQVEPNTLYVEDGPVLTSAGTSAGIDLCLHLIRSVHGSEVATRLARRMVVPPHRDGGQAQYVEAPLPRAPDAPTLQPLLAWLVAHLDQPVDVESLARRAHMAPRTFARRFRAETGTTPHDWVTSQRILLARRLLEETGLGVDAVAARSGFGDAAMLRHHFTRRVGTTPHAYRATFRAAATGSAGRAAATARR